MKRDEFTREYSWNMSGRFYRKRLICIIGHGPRQSGVYHMKFLAFSLIFRRDFLWPSCQSKRLIHLTETLSPLDPARLPKKLFVHVQKNDEITKKIKSSKRNLKFTSDRLSTIGQRNIICLSINYEALNTQNRQHRKSDSDRRNKKSTHNILRLC